MSQVELSLTDRSRHCDMERNSTLGGVLDPNGEWRRPSSRSRNSRLGLCLRHQLSRPRRMKLMSGRRRTASTATSGPREILLPACWGNSDMSSPPLMMLTAETTCVAVVVYHQFRTWRLALTGPSMGIGCPTFLLRFGLVGYTAASDDRSEGPVLQGWFQVLRRTRVTRGLRYVRRA